MSKPNKDFVPGTEQHLAAVWYALQYVLEDYNRNRDSIERGRVGKWYMIHRMKRLLGIESLPKRSYIQMRQDILNFALDFGVVGLHHDAPVSPENVNAMKEFGES